MSEYYLGRMLMIKQQNFSSHVFVSSAESSNSSLLIFCQFVLHSSKFANREQHSNFQRRSLLRNKNSKRTTFKVPREGIDLKAASPQDLENRFLEL